MNAAQLNEVLLIATVVLLIAVAAVRLSIRAGLPSLLVYLAIGLALGEAGFGIPFEDAELTQSLGLVALAVILAEGGLTTRWTAVRPVLGPAVTLATLGVAVSVVVTAAVAHFALGIDWRTAVLLGAVVSSTDAAAVFSVLRRLPIRGRLAATLEAESGLNDPLAIILVALVVSDAWGRTSPGVTLLQVLYQLLVGTAVGLAVGYAGQWLLARSALPAAGLYPLATMAIALFAYALGAVTHASGFLAVYVAALWLGNARLPHRNATLGFAEGLAWLAQIGMFVLLGLLASPARLPVAIVPALIVGGGLLLLARPLAVLSSATWFRVPWREQAFMSWAGLRGAVPIVLATIPLSTGFPDAAAVFDMVFVLVVVFTLIQAPTLPWVARRLGVTETGATREVDVESAPLEKAGADLLQLTVPPESRLTGVYVNDLRLPQGAAVTLVVRDGRTFVPDQHTCLSAGDHVLVVATAAARSDTERRLRAISRAGRLAHWHGERGDETPTRPTSSSAPPVSRSVSERNRHRVSASRTATPAPQTGTLGEQPQPSPPKRAADRPTSAYLPLVPVGARTSGEQRTADSQTQSS